MITQKPESIKCLGIILCNQKSRPIIMREKPHHTRFKIAMKILLVVTTVDVVYEVEQSSIAAGIMIRMKFLDGANGIGLKV